MRSSPWAEGIKQFVSNAIPDHPMPIAARLRPDERIPHKSIRIDTPSALFGEYNAKLKRALSHVVGGRAKRPSSGMFKQGAHGVVVSYAREHSQGGNAAVSTPPLPNEAHCFDAPPRWPPSLHPQAT